MGVKQSTTKTPPPPPPLLTVDEVRAYAKKRFPKRPHPPLVPLTVDIIRQRMRAGVQNTGDDLNETWLEKFAPIFEGTANDRHIAATIRLYKVSSETHLAKEANEYEEARIAAKTPMPFYSDIEVQDRRFRPSFKTISKWLEGNDPSPQYADDAHYTIVSKGPLYGMRGPAFVKVKVPPGDPDFLEYDLCICDDGKIASNCNNRLVFTLLDNVTGNQKPRKRSKAPARASR